MKKHNLDNFYIGELYIGYELGNLLGKRELTDEQLKSIDTKKKLILNGAIPFERGLFNKKN